MNFNMTNCKICKSKRVKKFFEYKKKPYEEKTYSNIAYDKYNRAYYKCIKCKHLSGYLKMKISNLYSSNYNQTIYSGELKKNFKKINNLVNKKSDNFFRVKRIDEFLKKEKIKKINKFKILDIGSGLGIFPYKMKKKNYNITGLDPDIKSCLHIKKNLKIKCIHGDFLKISIKEKFNMITLNKVIEHVSDPTKMLNKAKKVLKKNGLIYIEVPDIKASIKGKNREEFHIDHLHVFSKNSLNFLTKKIKFKKKIIKNIKEPSGKFNIFGIFTK